MSNKDNREPTVIWVDYVFSQEELASIASQLAADSLEADNLEDEKKAIAADYKAKIELINARKKIASSQITNGKEKIKVQALLERDSVRKKRIYWDKETGEIIREEDFQPEDYNRLF